MKLTTETNYIDSLNRLSKFGIDINNIDFELLERICTDNKINENGRNLYYNSLLWYYKEKNIDSSVIDILREKIDNSRSKTIEKYMSHELSDNERNNFLKWESILKVHDMMKKDIKTNKKFLNYLILSLYIYNPPRRLDYSNMILNDNIKISDDDIILWNDNKKNYVTKKVNEIDSNNNYYVRKNGTSFYIFNDYKTSYIYGKQIIEVDPTLQQLINQYIEKSKILNNSILFKLSKTSLSNKLAKIFIKYQNKRISASLLRHSYITYLYTKKPVNFDFTAYIIGKKMSHSIIMQSLYAKKLDESSEIIPCNQAI
jgi:integrase